MLCPPDYYGIEYEINPWMSRARGADTPLVQAQWRGLHEKLLSLGCNVHLVPPQAEAARHGLHRQRRADRRQEIYPE